MKRRKIMPDIDFELVFTPHGSVQLIDMNEDKQVWSSDNDQDFAEEFDGDFFDAKDAEEILEWLEEQDLIDLDDAEIDIVEEDADEEDSDVIDDDNIIEADFTPVRTAAQRTTKRKPK